MNETEIKRIRDEINVAIGNLMLASMSLNNGFANCAQPEIHRGMRRLEEVTKTLELKLKECTQKLQTH